MLGNSVYGYMTFGGLLREVGCVLKLGEFRSLHVTETLVSFSREKFRKKCPELT
jgi:hypothetical protein